MDGENANWFETYFSADADTPAVDEAATQVAAPEVESSPVAEIAPELDAVAPVEVTEDATDAIEATEDESDPAATEPPPIDWTRPDLQPVVEAAQRWQALQQQAEQIKRQRASMEFQNAAKELVEDDPERLQQFHGLVAQVAAPAVQQAHQAIQQTEAVGKSFAAFWNAVKANSTEDQLKAYLSEMDDLMQVEGGENMERRAMSKKEAQRQLQTELSTRDQRIAELERALSAQGQLAQREANGADLVDSGAGGMTGIGSRTDRMRNATSMDDYWSAMVGRD
jgi:hypothetical protein